MSEAYANFMRVNSALGQVGLSQVGLGPILSLVGMCLIKNSLFNKS